MHVLMLSDVYFPRINGVSTSMQTFRHALGAHGIRLTIAAPEYPGHIETDGVVRIASRQVPLDPEDRLMTRAGLKAFSRRVASADFSLIHVQTPFAAHYAGIKLARRQGVPVIATYHTHFEEYLFHYLPIVPRRALRGLARHTARGQCNALDGLVVPSQPMAQTLRDYGIITPLHVIPTGLPTSQFIRGDGQRFRAAHGIGAERKIALFVGRAAFEKNIGFLLEVAAHARQQQPNLLLVIAGEGPALESLQRKTSQLGINDHVRFVGYLPRESGLRDCYAAADVFTFASRTETQGLVLLEAMAVGLPVLALPALGAAEIIAPQRGAVVAVDAPGAFADQLVALLDQPARLATLSREGITFAREWDAATQGKRLASLYRDIVVRFRSNTAPLPVTTA
ncbi:glycosyl transferase family 1 [Rugosibacter aromaticivorans]|uniref:Glycosyl transferase family 1 n=1 Tax=Rugosibacter aromaticivorans TaxID=1565605 RepID=A0A0C5J9L7_9PROT|nr:glycosyltransferase [Rugosibacter aromaticivorans]AJP48463.1 glycosyl transferase family 1 [Rugosibacter aromaticivorans]TBR15332.1 MAG: glycosyltransferase family 4 protein [Rugosibacter sp.]